MLQKAYRVFLMATWAISLNIFLCSIGIPYYDHLLISRFFLKIILSLKFSLSTVVSLLGGSKWVWMFFWKGQVSGVPKNHSVDKGFHLKGPSWGAHQGVWIVLSIANITYGMLIGACPNDQRPVFLFAESMPSPASLPFWWVLSSWTPGDHSLASQAEP